MYSIFLNIWKIKIFKQMKRKIRLLAIICVFLGVGSQLLAQTDGARTYWPQAKGTDIISPMYYYINSSRVANNNLYYKNGDFTTNLTGLNYKKFLNIKGRTASFSLAWFYGSTEGEVKGEESFNAGLSSGISDLYGAVTINLLGASSVTPEEFMKAKYDWVVDLELACSAPLGNYDYKKKLNIGTNRWEIKAGVPIMKFYNWGTTKMSSIELIPSVSYYTKNNNPVDNEDALLEQDMTFSFEGHYTRNFNKILWASANAYYLFGGETSIHPDHGEDYVPGDNDVTYNDDQINSLQLGVTVGADFTKRIKMKVSYGGVVYHNDDGIDGTTLGVSASYSF